MEKITGGMSNDVFRYRDLIFKFYNYSQLELNYTFEELVQKKLYEKYKNVPEITQSIYVDGKLIGRIEKYIDSVPVTKSHFISPRNAHIYANLLKSIHTIDIDCFKETGPYFFIYLDNWAKICHGIFTDEEFKEDFVKHKINYESIKVQANKYIEALLEFILHMQFKLCLSHNDFQQLNVLVAKSNPDDFYVIDFEYTSLNYPYYDIANYFSECAFDNSAVTYDPILYPDINSRYNFYQEYFKDLEPNVAKSEIDYIVMQFCPLVEYYWYIWSLIKYSHTKCSDYLVYGKIRETNFINKLAELKNCKI